MYSWANILWEEETPLRVGMSSGREGACDRSTLKSGSWKRADDARGNNASEAWVHGVSEKEFMKSCLLLLIGGSRQRKLSRSSQSGAHENPPQVGSVRLWFYRYFPPTPPTGCQAFPMSSDVYRTPLSRICKLCALQIVLHVSIDTLMYLFRDKCGNRLWMQLRFANFAMFVWLHSYFVVSFEIKKQPRFPIYSCLAGCKWGLINLCDYSFFFFFSLLTKPNIAREEKRQLHSWHLYINFLSCPSHLGSMIANVQILRLLSLTYVSGGLGRRTFHVTSRTRQILPIHFCFNYINMEKKSRSTMRAHVLTEAQKLKLVRCWGRRLLPTKK